LKLRAKILLTLLPLVIAPLALLAAITAKELEQAREHAIAVRLLGPIEAVASRFQWLMRGARGDLTALARLHNDAAESGPQTLYAEIQRSFRLTQQTRVGYLDLMLISEKGEVQVRSHQTPGNKRYTSQPAIAAMLRDEADEFSTLIPVDSKKRGHCGFQNALRLTTVFGPFRACPRAISWWWLVWIDWAKSRLMNR